MGTISFVDRKIEEFNPPHNNCVLASYVLAYENAKSNYGIIESENKKADKKINNWFKKALEEAIEEGKKIENAEVVGILKASASVFRSQGYSEYADSVDVLIKGITK